MWTRQQLKEKAKIAFKRNYWKCILVAMFIGLIAGGGGAASASGNSPDFDSLNKQRDTDIIYEDVQDFNFDEFPQEYDDGLEDEFPQEYDDSDLNLDQIGVGVAIVIILVAIIVFAVIMALVIVLDAFILNPIELGSKRFFLVNLNDIAQVKEIAFGFDNCYKNTVKIMFYRDLYTVLWSLLFIIPGIVKSYEYRMIPYILADHPDMSKEQAFALSKQMMTGQKWNAFVLDLSFIPWHLLSIITLGIVEIFYVSPYVQQTNAALYEALKYGYGQPYDGSFNPNMNYGYGQQAPNMNYGQPTQQAPNMNYGQPTQQAPNMNYGQPVQQEPDNTNTENQTE